MSLPEGLKLEVSIDYDGWRDALPDYEKIIHNAVQAVISGIPEGASLRKFADIELSIVLCDDTLIHQLNNDYRKQDKATNVLSFEGLGPNERDTYLRSDQDIPEIPFSLGEIYIAYETVEREAVTAGVSIAEHFCHLVIHGILHLLGYDHIEDDDAQVMEAHETRVLSYLGIDDPYAA